MSRVQQPALYKSVAQTFRALGQPARIKILLAIGGGEACVCHLEAALGMRQAYISQQLMALRQEEIVDTRRDGRNIFYYLKDVRTLDLIRQAAIQAGFPVAVNELNTPTALLSNCCCPHCAEAREACQALPETAHLAQVPG